MPGRQGLFAPDAVGLFVISANRGESVVVTLPDGKWFVVDAHSDSRFFFEFGPTAHFIEHFELPVEDCLFVLLTHFHDDHYSGIVRLLDYLRNKSKDSDRPTGPPFATHPAYHFNAIADDVEAFLDNEIKHQTTSADKRRGRSLHVSAYEVLKMCQHVYEDVHPWRVVYRHKGKTECRVFAFLPARKIENRYLRGTAAKRRLAKFLPKKQVPPKVLSKLSLKRRSILNDMSIGLAIEYGDTFILLTGDADKPAWRAAAGESGPAINAHRIRSPLHRSRKVTMLKSPHHASEKAWNPTLARVYRDAHSAIATHHCRGSYALPTAEGLKRIFDTGTSIAVPDKRLLSKIPQQWEIQREPLSGHKSRKATGDADLGNAQEKVRSKARSLSRRYKTHFDVVPLGIQWVGALVDSRKRAQWLGGENAVLLKPGLTRPGGGS